MKSAELKPMEEGQRPGWNQLPTSKILILSYCVILASLPINKRMLKMNIKSMVLNLWIAAPMVGIIKPFHRVA